MPAVRLLKYQFDALDIDCVIDAPRHGANAKVSNLINMLPRCRHDLLVMADSDIQVPPDYTVGLVSCPYVGRALRVVAGAGRDVHQPLVHAECASGGTVRIAGLRFRGHDRNAPPGARALGRPWPLERSPG